MPKRFVKSASRASKTFKSPSSDVVGKAMLSDASAAADGKVDFQESTDEPAEDAGAEVREIIEDGLARLKEWLDLRLRQQDQMQLQRQEELLRYISRVATNSEGRGDIAVEDRTGPTLASQAKSVTTNKTQAIAMMEPNNGAANASLETLPLLDSSQPQLSFEPEGKSKEKMDQREASSMYTWPASRKEVSLVQDWQSRFVDIFDQLDLDRSGSIDRYEFMEAFADAHLPDIGAFKRFKNASRGHGDSLDRDEWLQILAEVSKGTDEEIQLLIEFLDRIAKLCEERGGNIYADRRQKPPLILRHDSTLRMTWDMFLCILLFYVSISVPFSLGFGQSDLLDALDLVTDILFCCDVLLNFRTTYLDSEEFIIMDPKMIAVRYLKSWFLLDFVSSVPFDAITAGILPNMTPARLLKIGKVSKVLKLLRLSKIMTVLAESEFTEKIDNLISSKGYQTFARIAKLVIMAFIVAHWLACFGNFIDQRSLEAYFDGAEPEATALEKYVAGIYWAMTTLSTVGYGDITPKSDEERLYAMVAMVIGGSMYGYVIGSVTSIVTDMDVQSHAYQERLELVQSWLDGHSNEIPAVLRRRLRKYFKRSLVAKSAMEDSAVVTELSPDLRAKTAYFLIHDNVKKHPMFDGLGNAILGKLVEVLRKNTVNKQEYVVNRGDPGIAMYILVAGLARYEQGVPWFPPELPVQVSNPKFQQVLPGDSFGEEIIFGMEETYGYTIVALSDCEIHSISEDDFQGGYSNMPELVKTMQEAWLTSKRVAALGDAVEPQSPDQLKANSPQLSVPGGRKRERSASKLSDRGKSKSNPPRPQSE